MKGFAIPVNVGSGCKYSPKLTSDHIDALRWLARTIDRIIHKGESHRSYKHALDVKDAVIEVCERYHSAHNAVHELEYTLDKAREAADELQDQLDRANRRCETLELLLNAEREDEEQLTAENCA